MSGYQDLSGWTPLTFEPAIALQGRSARLERLSIDAHAEELFAANAIDPGIWRFMPYGPFATFGAYRGWVAAASVSEDPVFYAIAGDAGWSGVASYLRIDRDNGVIEIGHIALTPQVQRTRAATEAIHLMIDQAFASGFRRVEWKCNAANAASRRAAYRYGFTYEGTFRQHMITKGANRDTAWFAILDGDWPRLRAAHLAWLDPANFDASGQQLRSMMSLVADSGAGDPSLPQT